MARPAYEPTPADRATVQYLAASGAKHDDIARCLGTYGVTAKTMRKHFRRELDVSADQLRALSMSKLYTAIEAGEAWAVKFHLERKCGFAEAHRLVDGEGKDRGLSLADIDAAIDADEQSDNQ